MIKTLEYCPDCVVVIKKQSNTKPNMNYDRNINITNDNRSLLNNANINFKMLNHIISHIRQTLYTTSPPFLLLYYIHSLLMMNYTELFDYAYGDIPTACICYSSHHTRQKEMQDMFWTLFQNCNK